MTGLLLSYIWLWQGAFRGAFFVCVLGYLGIGVASHANRGETARQIGFRLDNLKRAARQALIFVGPLCLVPPLIGIGLHSLRTPFAGSWPLSLAVGFMWATLQQYGLLAFYYRRCGEVLNRRWTAMVAASGMFALFHLPNPFLTPVTLLAGLLSCWLYSRVPNLFALGLAHTAMSIAISRSLSHDVTFGMRVGPGFLRFLDSLRAALDTSLILISGMTSALGL